MKSLHYKSRIVLSNLIIFTITMLVILFISLQSAWYYSVEDLKSEMLETARDINLYINEQTAQLSNDSDREDYIINNSAVIYSVTSSFSNYNVELFDNNGSILNRESLIFEPVIMNDEFQEVSRNGEPAISIRNNNGKRELWLFSPVISKNKSAIGYVALIASLEHALSLQWFILKILGFCLLFGFIILAIATAYFSNSFVRPIRKLTRISGEINKGDYDRVIIYKKDDEIGDLAQVYNEMIQNVNRVIIQLRSERQRLGSVLASLDDGLLAINRSGEVITSNRFIKIYFDLADPKSIEDFSSHPFFKEIFESLKSGKTSVSEEVEIGGRTLLITGSPITHEATEENYLFIIRNITTTRTLEKEQRKFISSISHELRTPLTTIIGYTDMLNRRQVNDPNLLSKSLNTINREGHRLVRLVDDLLNANSVEDMVLSIRKERISLEKLLDRVVEQMRIKSWEKEIEIAFKAESNLPDIYGDYDRLSQTFINIIHNAIKFSSRGGIIDVVLTREDEENLSVSIRDYGTGIDPAKKDFIFSAFYRVDEDRARNEGEGGAGLGLYLVKQVVDKHDGKIRVDSEVEEGTNITIILPLNVEDDLGGEA